MMSLLPVPLIYGIALSLLHIQGDEAKGYEKAALK